MSDLFPLATGFVLACPAMEAGPSPVREIRQRGNVPLVLQQDVVVELKRTDMLESWRSTCALGRKKAEEMIRSAATRISAALEDEDNADLEDLSRNMTAFFLLAVHQKGMNVQDAARFCTLAWQGSADQPLSISRY